MFLRTLKSKQPYPSLYKSSFSTIKYSTDVNEFHNLVINNPNKFALAPLSMQNEYLNFLNKNNYDPPIKYRDIKYYIDNTLKSYSIHNNNPEICEIDVTYDNNFINEYVLQSLLEEVRGFYINFYKFVPVNIKTNVDNIIIKFLINGDKVARNEFQLLPSYIKHIVFKEIKNYSFDKLYEFVFTLKEFNKLKMTKTNKFIKYTSPNEIQYNYALKDGINEDVHILNPYCNDCRGGFHFTIEDNYDWLSMYKYKRSLTIPNNYNGFVKIGHGQTARATVIKLGPKKMITSDHKFYFGFE